MPLDAPEASLQALLEAEELLRVGGEVATAEQIAARVNPFWADLVRLLVAHHYYVSGQQDAIAIVLDRMTSHVYDPYLTWQQERSPYAAPE